MKSLLLLLALATRHNSLGTVSYEQNPFTYKAGSVVAVFEVGHGKGYVLRVQPYKTYLQFFEDVLVCGETTDVAGQRNDAADLFNDKKNPMMIVYRTRASQTIEGIGCHELVGVNEIEVKNGLLPKTR